MKLVIFSFLVAASLAAPQNLERDAVTLLDEREDQGNGNFNYVYETSNGIYEQRQGQPGVKGQINMEGSYRFTFPDGTPAEVTFVADENGFVAQSPLIPTSPPLPAHVYELLRIAEEQRAAGITFD